MNLQPIIPPVDPALIKAELTPERLLRKTNKAGNELYVITAHNAPQTMREIGRLREEAFRDGGGGTGTEIDIDIYDTRDESPYYQLIVWNPDREEIMGGYRFIFGNDVPLMADGQPDLASKSLYRFSEKWIREELPITLELGRSFVALQYQSSKAGAKALFTLDNLWDGLGALSIVRPTMKYFFGKVTIYSKYPRAASDLIYTYWHKHFPCDADMIIPIDSVKMATEITTLEQIFTGNDLKEDYKILNQEVRKLGTNIPPLVSAYTTLSDTMRYFGTGMNYDFGDVEESAITVTIRDIAPNKKERHLDTFIPNPEFKL